jgi:hypothetical protein
MPGVPTEMPRDMHVWITYSVQEFGKFLKLLFSRQDAELISVNRTLGAAHGYVVTYQCDDELDLVVR